MNCICCGTHDNEDDMIIQMTIFQTKEYYCRKCWNDLIPEEDEEEKVAV